MIKHLKAHIPRLLACIAFAPMFAGCAPLEPRFVEDTYGGTPSKFFVCHGYNCMKQSAASMNSAQWREVGTHFDPTPETPLDERRRIAPAIAMIEAAAGAQTGTDIDRAGVGFPKTDFTQLDCVDEAINTTRYLRMIEDSGWLRHHTVLNPARRGYAVDGIWTHNSAVIRDDTTGRKYAVDTWFFDNGHPPAIVPLDDWMDGWRVPDDEDGNPVPGPDGRYIR